MMYLIPASTSELQTIVAKEFVKGSGGKIRDEIITSEGIPVACTSEVADILGLEPWHRPLPSFEVCMTPDVGTSVELAIETNRQADFYDIGSRLLDISNEDAEELFLGIA